MWLAFEGKSGLTVVNRLKTFLNISYSNPGRRLVSGFLTDVYPDSIVFNAQFKTARLFTNADFQLVLPDFRSQAMLNRVFYQRLQN